MIYDLHISRIAARYVPTWFRWPRNIALVAALCAWVSRIHDEFLAWREAVIIGQYRYTGLIHSLEAALNDRFSAVERRITITVVDQVPMQYHWGDGGASPVGYATEGTLTGYYHLTEGVVAQPYDYEFLVHVPAEISFSPPAMFRLLDLYRFAGLRPAIRRYSGDVTVETILYWQRPAANEEQVSIQWLDNTNSE